MGAGLTINDVDRTSRCSLKPTWSRALGQRGASRFTIVVPHEDYEPLVGQQAVWFDGATRVWSGTIDTRSRRKIKRGAATPAGISYDCTANSLEQRLDKRYITKTVVDQDAGTIVSNLIGDELGAEGVSAGTISAGVHVDILVWDNIRASDVLTQLANLSGYSWYVDPDNFLQFGPPSDNPAPWTLTDADIEWPVTLPQVRSDYRNRQLIRVTSVSPPEREIFTGDGATVAFATRKDIKEILSVTLTTSTRAQQTGTFTGIPADGDTISIGSFNYTFRAAINNRNPFEIFINPSTVADNAENLLRAVNDNLDHKGSIYTWPTIANFDVDVERVGDGVIIRCKFPGASENLGGFVPLASTGSAFAWDGSDIDGGVDGTDTVLTFGIAGQSGDSAWTYTPGTQAINAGATGAAPEVGQFLVVEYRPIGFDVIAVQDDTAVADRAAVEGGSGTYEHLLDRSDLTDFNSALSTAWAQLDAFATLVEDLQFSTIRSGLQPGQILTVLSTKLGISVSGPSGLVGVPYLVESVDAEFIGLNNGQHKYWRYTVKAVITRRSNWLQAWEKLAATGAGIGGSAVTAGSGISGSPVPGGGGGSTSGAGDVTDIAVTGFIDPMTFTVTLNVSVTPPSPLNDALGCHLWCEIPDKSAGTSFTLGTSTVGGSDPIAGIWQPIDAGLQPFGSGATSVWTISFPGPPDIDPSKDIPCRLYAPTYTAVVDNAVIRATLPSPSPNKTFTLVSLTSGTPTAGTNITKISGPITASVLPDQNVDGKLKTPVQVGVSNSPADVPGWQYQIVLTFEDDDPTIVGNQQVVACPYSDPGFPQAPADGIQLDHTFALDTPTTIQHYTVWLQSGLMDAGGVMQWNNIVPGITPFAQITIGTTTGTTDAASVILASINSSMAVVGTLFGVAAAGITNPYLGPGAVGTLNIQNLAVTNPILGALAVQAANLANSSVTATAIANLAVGTAAMQLLSVDTSIMANLAVSQAKIQNLAVTGAKMANLTVVSANIALATITGANIAIATIRGLNVANATITDAHIGNLSASKLTAGTITATISITAPTINGGIINAATLIGGTITGGSLVIPMNFGGQLRINQNEGFFFQGATGRVQIQGNNVLVSGATFSILASDGLSGSSINGISYGISGFGVTLAGNTQISPTSGGQFIGPGGVNCNGAFVRASGFGVIGAGDGVNAIMTIPGLVVNGVSKSGLIFNGGLLTLAF